MSTSLVERGKDTPVSALNKLLLANQKQIELALPKHLRPERLIRLAVTALHTTPSLQDCSMLSIANSVMLAAQLGLEINNGLGHGWLIPYKRVCTYQPGYRGLLELSYRTQKIKDARPIMVYEFEPFEYEEGAHPKFNHTPLRPEHRGTEWIGAYNRLTHTDGFESVYWMWRQEIEEIRDKCSRTKDSGPWVTWFAEMVKKTVVKRQLKLSQLSPEIGFAVGIDDQAEAHASNGDEPKRHKPEVVQDMVLEDSLIEQAHQVDDALAGSREAQKDVLTLKLMQSNLLQKIPKGKQGEGLRQAIENAKTENEILDIELAMKEAKNENP